MEKLKLPDILHKKLENKLIGLAFKVIKSFIRDWQKSPYKWDKEIDIQVEIASRIKTCYQKLGKDEMNASYKVNIKGFEREQVYSRVCCEPIVFYKYEDGIRYPCFPDIVIYQDIENPKPPPDETEQKTNWPMLWICEIKYWTEWISTPKKDDWDINKMKYLLKQKDGTKSACWLTFYRERERDLSSKGIKIKRYENNRLWECVVRLPAIKKNW